MMKKIFFILLLLPIFGFTQEIFFSKSNGEIIRASIDGLTQTVFYTAPSGRYVHAVTVDTINNKIYWNETFPNSSSKIMRSDLSTLVPELVLNISSSTIDKIEIARDTNLIFWCGDDRIFSNANGLETEIFNWTGAKYFCIDNLNNYIYFSGPNTNLGRIDFDGSNYTGLGGGVYKRSLYMDELNQKIYSTYYYNQSEVKCYDIATDSESTVWTCQFGGCGINTSISMYDFNLGNPTILWTDTDNHNIRKIYADGTGYQILLNANYPRHIDVSGSIPGLGNNQNIILAPEIIEQGKSIFFSKSNGEIIKSSANGQIQTVFYAAPSGSNIYAVRLDNINNKIYWNETFPNSSSKIMRSDLSTLSPELVLHISASTIDKIEVARDTNLIFWCDDDRIFSNANGLETEIFNWTGAKYFCIDNLNNYIYFSGPNTNIGRIDFDGSNYTGLGGGVYKRSLYMDELNQKIYSTYYYNQSEVKCYDIATDSESTVWTCQFGGCGINTSISMYDFDLGNPTILWTDTDNHNIRKIYADGTGYQILLNANYPRYIDIQKKTGRIEGSVYLDLNFDGNYDTTDIPLGNQILELENINGEKTYLTTKPYGNYSFEVDTSQYTLRFFTDTLWTETSNTYSYSINVGPDTVISDLNFGIAPQITKGDMFVDITTSSTVCNMPTSIWLNVKNIGTMTINDVNLDLWFDDTYTVLDPAGGTVNGNKISWNFPIDFDPYLFTGQDTMLNVSVQIPPAPVNGSFIDSVRVSPVQSNILEMKSNNNFDSISNVLLCSYDPNDKQVVPQKCFYDELDTLDYTIRFQNTGNYPATTVRLVDSLDFEKLDILSFEFIGASHAHTWSLSSPSVLEVVFNNIMLVDSSVSFDDSQGFFKYRIVVRDSLPDMQATSSAAFIYFDLNAPIITNLPVVNFIDDGNCIYGGCMDTLAANFDPFAIVNDGSCLYCDISNSMIVTQNTFGNCDGLIIANSSSSYGPISYLWNTGSTQSIIYGLCSGVYSVSISDTLGCSLSETVFIGVAGGCTDTLACNYDSTVLFDDGSCLNIFGCTDSTAFNYDPIANCDDGSCIPNLFGCTDPNAFNYAPGANVDNGSCMYLGCTDNLALNFDSSATIDDGSCIYSYICTTPRPDGLYAYDIIDTRAKIGWNNMNDSACMVWKYFVRYREVGTQLWNTKSAGVGNGLCNFGLNTVNKQLLNLSPNTTYEFKMKAFYCDSTSSNYSPAVQFITEDVCPDMINLTATIFNNNQSKVRFDWDTTGVYTFARILLRVDTAGSNWQTAGGFGVYYPTLFVNKFGLQSGETYRAQGRTFCDSNITAYRSPSWTSPIYWTQPGSIREGGGLSINNLDIYPNPSNDVFNITFNSDKLQDLMVRIFSVVGKEVYKEEKQQFIGEYTKQISLDDYGKGIYFLEIENNSGVVNKKLMLQ